MSWTDGHLPAADHPRRRSDLGASRLPAAIETKLMSLLGGQEQPAMRDLVMKVAAYCTRRRLPPPARATLYAALARVPVARFSMNELPDSVRRTLHNLDREAVVPGDQVAFAAFNRGDSAALCWASGLPWPCLRHAARMPGFRPKSRALLLAVMRYRGITKPGLA